MNPNQLKKQLELAGVVKIPTELEKLQEGIGFGPAGYGGEKNPAQNLLSRVGKSLRVAKVALRDGDVEKAAAIIDEVYSYVSQHNEG